MSEERQGVTEDKMTQQGAKPGRFLGSLKDALAAASRDDTQRGPAPTAAEPTTQLAPKTEAAKPRLRQPSPSRPTPLRQRRRPAPVSALPMRRAR